MLSLSARQIPLLKALAENRALVVKAMAHPTRLLIMEALMQGECCVNELTDMAGCDITTLSKHLAVMKRAGLLACEKRGLNVYYQIACPCFPEFFRCIDLVIRAGRKNLRCAC
jgi:ArsR family transcriptional regulator